MQLSHQPGGRSDIDGRTVSHGTRPALGRVHRFRIGARGRRCRVDPVAGRNLMGCNPHNVAICEMSIANNLVVRDNRGTLMVRDNKACNDLRVVDNHVRSMRVISNSYAGNFSVARNTWVNRKIVRNNVELRQSPAACRRAG